jgi:hypothetical protein
LWGLALPFGIALSCQLLIWILPDCGPNPYSLVGCEVFSVSLAAPLVFGLVGGLYAGAVLGVFVFLPLLFASAIWSLLRKPRAGDRD